MTTLHRPKTARSRIGLRNLQDVQDMAHPNESAGLLVCGRVRVIDVGQQ
jgi:hypothetical protein